MFLLTLKLWLVPFYCLVNQNDVVRELLSFPTRVHVSETWLLLKKETRVWFETKLSFLEPFNSTRITVYIYIYIYIYIFFWVDDFCSNYNTYLQFDFTKCWLGKSVMTRKPWRSHFFSKAAPAWMAQDVPQLLFEIPLIPSQLSWSPQY